MILNCPKCNSRFLVADRLIPSAGRTVRCGACGNQWHVTSHVHIADAFAELAEEAARAETSIAPEDVIAEDHFPQIRPLAEGANVPALTKRKLSAKPFKIAVPILLVFWIIFAFMTYFPHWVGAPVLSSIYGMFGINSTQGLVFADVHMERDDSGTKTKFILSGSIVNHAAVTRKVPTVYIALKDKNGHKVWARDYPVNVELKAGEVYPFRIVNVETSFAASVTSIVLDLGNSLELMVR